jgi:hypothetical protein
VVDSDHYPHFGVHANGNDPRGFAFASDPAKNATFLALAAVAKATGKKLKVYYEVSNPNVPSINGVSKVEVVG